mmetsp:Transcript_2940/g.7679  ORF Transcript_2940/g.7679 Transcript_2940/m.7679 type:complete len:213 (-) Transcript_2940:916-1554(-)
MYTMAHARLDKFCAANSSMRVLASMDSAAGRTLSGTYRIFANAQAVLARPRASNVCKCCRLRAYRWAASAFAPSPMGGGGGVFVGQPAPAGGASCPCPFWAARACAAASALDMFGRGLAEAAAAHACGAALALLFADACSASTSLGARDTALEMLKKSKLCPRARTSASNSPTQLALIMLLFRATDTPLPRVRLRGGCGSCCMAATGRCAWC